MKIICVIILVITSFLVHGADSSKVNQISNQDSIQVAEPFIIQPQVSITNDIPEESTDYFGAIMPLLTLVLGFVMNKWYDNYTRNKTLKNKGLEWVQSFLQLRAPLEKQIETLEEYIPNNDENSFYIEDAKHEIQLDCQNFKSLDEKALVPFLSSGNNKLKYREAVELSGKLQNLVSLIEFTSKRYKETFSILQKETSNHITLFNSEFNDFKTKVAEYHSFAIEEYPEQTPKHDAALEMGRLMTTYIFPFLESGEINLFELSETFIEPFFKATHADKDHEIMREVISSLNLCDRHIKAARMEKKYFRIKLEKELVSYKKRQDTLVKLLEVKKISEE